MQASRQEGRSEKPLGGSSWHVPGTGRWPAGLVQSEPGKQLRAGPGRRRRRWEGGRLQVVSSGNDRLSLFVEGLSGH